MRLNHLHYAFVALLGAGLVSCGEARADALTYKYDQARTGQNPWERTLTLENVNVAHFGKIRVLPTDGKVDAWPVYLGPLEVAGKSRNVLFVATEHDSVYAFDADDGQELWKRSVLEPGETPSGPHGCNQVAPTIGITATPVLDRAAGPHGAIYVVAMSNRGVDFQRLHALDVTTGAELFHGPREITATYRRAGEPEQVFEPGQYEERAALLGSHGTVYTTWTSHCDHAPYTGWIIAYNAANLEQVGVLNVGPGGTGVGPAGAGPGIWMSGGGPAADASGNIYLVTGNGPFERTLTAQHLPNRGDFGNSFLKFAPGGHLPLVDYFAPFNGVNESEADLDLGSGGIMLLPNLTDARGIVRELAVGAGKAGDLYVVNRASLGKFSADANNVWQELPGVLAGGVFSTPAWFDGTLYYGPVGRSLLAFRAEDARFSQVPTQHTAQIFEYPGTSPVISSNNGSNAILWAHENSNPAVLHAYDAHNLAHELYNSSQAAGGRDHFGPGNKFITPMVAHGKVFVGTQTGVAVFGLLP